MIERGFAACVAPDYGPEGQATFRAFAAADAIARRLIAGNAGFVALHGGAVAGFVEVTPERHIPLLFVDPPQHRRGIARRLLAAALEDRSGGPATVNASPRAVTAYQHLGFRPTGPERAENGLVFTPMALPAADEEPA
jgi:GNAT superfamily N-acetyltransferase